VGMNNIEIVEAVFEAFRARDLDRMADLLADDFVFTSPQDDHISKADFLSRCIPPAQDMPLHRTLLLVDAGEDNVLTMYEYTGSTGGTYRNTECLTVHDGKVVQTQVFFGGRY
jgi:ketosteroid isomerase-like protein